MRHALLALAGLALAATAQAKTPADLLGAWQMTSAQKGDKPLPDAVVSKMLMVIGPDSFAVGDEVGRIDALRGRKGRATMTRTQGPRKGERSQILYGFENGELVMATGQDGSVPASFRTSGDAGNVVARFRKQF